MPTPATSCLTGLLGLSRAATPCFPLPAAPADTTFITASTSGLYLDEVEGLILKPAPLSATPTDAWERFAKARAQAIEIVENELSRSLTLGPLLEQPAGALGGLGSGAVAPLGTPAALTVVMSKKPSLSWDILHVALYTDILAADVPVYLDDTLIGTVTTNGGLFSPLPDTVARIPFDGAAHTLRAELPEGVRPKQNTLTCGCGNQWVKSVSAALLDGSKTKTSAGGFVLQVQQVCDTGKPLCYAISQDAELAKSVALAVQYKTAEFTVVGLLAEANYSRYTTLDAKALEFMAGHYRALNHSTDPASPGHLTWLAGSSGLARVAQPCYGCAPNPYAPRLVRR